jgi:hypothetical protein
VCTAHARKQRKERNQKEGNLHDEKSDGIRAFTETGRSNASDGGEGRENLEVAIQGRGAKLTTQHGPKRICLS